MFSEMIKNCINGILSLDDIHLSEDEVKILAIELQGTSVHTINMISFAGHNITAINSFMAAIKGTSIHTINRMIFGGHNTIALISSFMAAIKDTSIHTVGFLDITDISVINALFASIKDTPIRTINLRSVSRFCELKPLAAAIKVSSLHTLNLNIDQHDLNAIAINTLLQGIKSTHIHTINLSLGNNRCNNNWLSPEIINAIKTGVENTPVNVISLRGNFNNTLSMDNTIASRHMILEILIGAASRTLVLDVSDCYINRELAIALMGKIKGSQIHTLNLKGNMISDDAKIALFAGIKDTFIHTLDLSGLSLDSKTMGALFAGIKGTHVHSVNLTKSKLKTSEINILATGIKDTSVHILNLSNTVRHDNNTEMDFARGRHLMEALAVSLPGSLIHTLILDDNKLDTDSISIFAAGIKGTNVTRVFGIKNASLDRVLKANLVKENGAIITASNILLPTIRNVTSNFHYLWSLPITLSEQPLTFMKQKINMINTLAVLKNLNRHLLLLLVATAYAFTYTIKCIWLLRAPTAHAITFSLKYLWLLRAKTPTIPHMRRSALMTELRIKTSAPVETQQENVLLKRQLAEMQQQILTMQQQMHLRMDIIARPLEQLHQTPRPVTRAFDMAVQANVFQAHTAETFSQTTDSLVRVIPANTWIFPYPLVNGGIEPRVRST